MPNRRLASAEPPPASRPAPPSSQLAFSHRGAILSGRRGREAVPSVRILVVEDEAHLASALKRGLAAEGFAVDVAPDGNQGLWCAREHDYDAVVLDIMLPGRNGYQVCATLREEGNWAPILMLTAKDGEYDEAEALDTGADDYLSKPFSFVVLVARLRALLRRGTARAPGCAGGGRPGPCTRHPPLPARANPTPPPRPAG